MLVFKFIMAIFPFVREMLFPGKSTKEVVKENKLATALAVLLTCSVWLNYYMVKRVYEIAMERKSEHAAQVAAKASEPAPTASAIAASAVAPAASADDTSKKDQDELRERLNGIFGK